jgi:hypothetical protein
MVIIDFVYEIDTTYISVRASSKGAFQKKQKRAH